MLNINYDVQTMTFPIRSEVQHKTVCVLKGNEE